MVLLFVSCSTSSHLKEVKSEFDISENKSQSSPDHVPESLRNKFEVSDDKLSPSDETKLVNKKNNPLVKRAKPLVQKSDKKPVTDPFPEGYPDHLKLINEKGKKVWDVYKPNHSPGEELFFQIKYLGINVGKLKLANVGRKTSNGKEVWHFQTRFRTASFYSSIYELDDSIDTYVNTDKFLSVRYSLIQRESNFDIDDIQLFDRHSLKTFWFLKQIKKKNGTKKNKEKTSFIPYYSLDPFSVVFFMQGLPLRKGDIYEIPMINKAEIITLKIESLGIEEIQIQDKSVSSIKMSARMGGKDKGEIIFWLSNNQQRSLLRANAKISIGSVNIELLN